MANNNHKDVLTTGQVARICNVAPRTVSKWFDSGQLRGYRIPGSKDRRIPKQQLMRFMKAYGIPLDNLETDQVRLLIVDDQADLTELLRDTLSVEQGYEVQVADNAFEAGALTEHFRPNVLLVDINLPGLAGRCMFRYLAGRSEFQDSRLIATSASMTEADRQSILQKGFHHTIAKPFHITDLVEAIKETRATVE
jgi:excisionase family DNA binding protein